MNNNNRLKDLLNLIFNLYIIIYNMNSFVFDNQINTLI